MEPLESARQWSGPAFAPLNPQSTVPFSAGFPCFSPSPAWISEECEKLTIQNMALTQTIEKLTLELSEIREKLEMYTASDGEPRFTPKKRKRRVAAAVPRFFQCPQCEKAYGYFLLRSEGSLLQHTRLKHSDETGK